MEGVPPTNKTCPKRRSNWEGQSAKMCQRIMPHMLFNVALWLIGRRQLGLGFIQPISCSHRLQLLDCVCQGGGLVAHELVPSLLPVLHSTAGIAGARSRRGRLRVSARAGVQQARPRKPASN
jgi:hypothetical protein